MVLPVTIFFLSIVLLITQMANQSQFKEMDKKYSELEAKYNILELNFDCLSDDVNRLENIKH